MAKKANDDNNQYTYVTSPIGTFLFPYLVKQDTKFDPKWSVTLQLSPKDNPDHKKFLAEVKALNETVGKELLDGITKGKSAYRIKDLIKVDEDADGNITGTYSIKFSTKTKPAVYDAAGKQIPDEIAGTIFGGSKGRVAISFKRSTNTSQKTVGLVAYFTKVQVTEIVKGNAGGDGASGDSGFGAVEGGFVVDTTGTQVDGGDF